MCCKPPQKLGRTNSLFFIPFAEHVGGLSDDAAHATTTTTAMRRLLQRMHHRQILLAVHTNGRTATDEETF